MAEHHETVRSFVKQVTARFSNSSYFEVYCIKPSGVVAAKQFRAGWPPDERTVSLERATAYVMDQNGNRGFNCYLGVNPAQEVGSPDGKVARPRSEDIESRQHILLDVEVEGSLRGKLPATDMEKEIAHASAGHVVGYLSDRGWGSPVVVDSGNGVQLAYRANLPNDEATAEKLKRLVEGLNALIEIPDVVVDAGAINPTVGFRIPGTMNYKEYQTTERPFRRALLISYNRNVEHPEITESDLDAILKALAAEKTAHPATTKYEPIEVASVEPITDANVESLRTIKAKTTFARQKAEQYYMAAVRNQCALMATTDSLRNIALISKASSIAHCWASFRHLLDTRHLRQGLDVMLEAGVASGLKRRECITACNNAMRYGLQSQRPPHPILESETKLKRGRPRKGTVKGTVLPSETPPKPLLQSIVGDYLDTFKVDGVSHLRHVAGSWHRWVNGGWSAIPVEEFLSAFAVYFETAMIAADLTPSSGDYSLCKRMMLAVARSKGIHSECFETPVGRIYFRSEWYDVTADRFNAYSPEVLNPYRLDCDVHTKGTYPEVFEQFMRDSLDPTHFVEQYRFIIEFMGYCLTNDTREQKMLYLVGEPGTGKSTFLSLLQRILGSVLVATPTVKHLAGGFAEQVLVGKRLICVTDTRTSGHVDVQAVIESLLSIVGDDVRTVARKYKDEWVGKLNCIFIMAMNDFPLLPDNSGALDRRRLIIRFGRTFDEATKDTRFLDKLLAEKDDVARLAFMADRKRRKEGRDLTQPPGMEDDVKEAVRASNWLYQFVEDEVDVVEDGDLKLTSSVTLHELFIAMGKWCKRNGINPVKSVQMFSKGLAKVLHGKYHREVECDRYGRKTYRYEWIRLRDPAMGEGDGNGRY